LEDDGEAAEVVCDAGVASVGELDAHADVEKKRDTINIPKTLFITFIATLSFG
jgi:hypothetical protein